MPEGGEDGVTARDELKESRKETYRNKFNQAVELNDE